MKLIALLAFFGVFIVVPSEALAQAYPERPIQIAVAFGAGGPNDLIARLIGDQLGKELKTSVAILNKPGAGGALGAAFAAQAKKDGYTLFLTSHANYLTAILQPKDVNYDMERDFEPVGKVAELASAVMVRSAAPWKNLTELLDHIKKNPKKVSCGVAAVGTMPYFVWLTLNSLGFETNGVIVANSPEGVAYLKGGHVEMSIESVPPSAPYLRDKSFRGLAVTTAKRVKEFPDIPTFPEAGHPEIGYFPQFAGLYAPAGTPGPILQTLSSALQKTMKDPAVLEKLEKMNFSADHQGPAEFKQMIGSFVPKIRTIAEKAGIIK
jgi:tripartite-type tricarboxylate transporter receptor subunit TctC